MRFSYRLEPLGFRRFLRSEKAPLYGDHVCPSIFLSPVSATKPFVRFS
jgi:hypothetical protein